MAAALVWLAALYALLGALFAPLFAWRGAARLDPLAREGTLGFRLVILPGSAALWPLLALRWARALRAGPQTAHDRAAKAGAP
jgi:hypothetical protein